MNDRIIDFDPLIEGVLIKRYKRFLADIKLESGEVVESVVIPENGRITACVSSQVGCAVDCSFCATGHQGFSRNLSLGEMLGQVWAINYMANVGRVTNVVLMGMGEPLDNFDAVVRAIDVLTQDAGLAFGPSKISVSTSGLVDKIDQLAEVVDPAVNLAVSVNAPSDEIRRKIMPVNRKWNMAELKGAMERFCSHPRRQILVEYVLLEGVNDSMECADLLANYLQGLKVKVNLSIELCKS